MFYSLHMTFSLQNRIPKEILSICHTLQKAGFQAYLVGGAIRDLLRLPQKDDVAKDFDIATSAHPEQVIQLFGKMRTLPTGLQHGTVTVLLPAPMLQKRTAKEHVEITTFRGESTYSDGRRPDQVIYLQDLTEDLRRRDFTINAIAYDPITNQLMDPFLGMQDLQTQWIKAVGDPIARFSEDGLRTLRAVRFASQLGFQIEEQTMQAISSSLATFRKVSWERIRDELCKLLLGIEVKQGLFLLWKTGLLQEILPELLQKIEDLSRWFSLVHLLPKDAELRLAGLLFCYRNADKPSAELEQILIRLKLSNQQRERIIKVLAAPAIDELSTATPQNLRSFLSMCHSQTRADLFLLEKGFAQSQGWTEQYKQLTQAEERITHELQKNPPLSLRDLALSGEEVIKICGMKPSKEVGQKLAQLFQRVLEQPELNTKEQLTAILLSHKLR